VQWLALVRVGQFVQLVNAEASLKEGLDVGLEGTMFPVKGHRQAVSAVRANTQFGLEIRPLDDKIVIVRGFPGWGERTA
jgi:hypothetical protein